MSVCLPSWTNAGCNEWTGTVGEMRLSHALVAQLANVCPVEN